MGQWLKAIGGYTVEQIGDAMTYYSWDLTIPSYLSIRQFSLRSNCLRNCIHTYLFHHYGLHSQSFAVAGPGLFLNLLHRVFYLSPRVA